MAEALESDRVIAHSCEKCGHYVIATAISRVQFLVATGRDMWGEVFIDENMQYAVPGTENWGIYFHHAHGPLISPITHKTPDISLQWTAVPVHPLAYPGLRTPYVVFSMPSP